jgi:Flp pilus assembly protein TadB
MYAIPIAVLIILALIAVAWTPLFALIIFVPLFLAFLVYVGMSRRADQEITPPQVPNAGPSHEDETKTGAWGERRG